MFEIYEEKFHQVIEGFRRQDESVKPILVEITNAAVAKVVNKWASGRAPSDAVEFKENAYQDINAHVWKKFLFGFLMKDGPEGQINDNLYSYIAWARTAAENVLRDKYRKEVRYKKAQDIVVEKAVDSDLTTCNLGEKRTEAKEQLKSAFDIVLSRDIEIYKVLTWIAEFLLVLEYNADMIGIRELIEVSFADVTLDEMARLLEWRADDFEWLEMSSEQKQKVSQALDKPWKDGRRYGDVKYKECFMKKGGRYTISDWINRVNNLVRRSYNEAFDD